MTNPPSTLPATDTLPLLRGLPEAWRLRLAASARPWHAEAGAILFDVGDACHDLALLASGAVRVVRPLASGQDILLYRLHPGELCVISTSCFLGNAPYPARGIVESPARGVVLSGAVVREAVAACAPFRELLFGSLADRLAGLMALLEELVARRLDSRLAALLVEHAPAVHTTHQQLADELASAREVVSRLLEGFESRGYVSLHRARIDVIDIAALRRVAEGGDAGIGR